MDSYTAPPDKRTENAWVLLLKETKQKSDGVNEKSKKAEYLRLDLCLFLYGLRMENVQVWGIGASVSSDYAVS